jgi:hypothetical protein
MAHRAWRRREERREKKGGEKERDLKRGLKSP